MNIKKALVLNLVVVAIAATFQVKADVTATDLVVVMGSSIAAPVSEDDKREQALSFLSCSQVGSKYALAGVLMNQGKTLAQAATETALPKSKVKKIYKGVVLTTPEQFLQVGVLVTISCEKERE